jgi:hypothetical protein
MEPGRGGYHHCHRRSLLPSDVRVTRSVGVVARPAPVSDHPAAATTAASAIAMLPPRTAAVYVRV